jgi:hypothetical protein
MDKIEHPISIENEYVEVFWLGHWNKCKYLGWEPVTEGSFTEPKEDSKYRIV